MLTKDDYKKSLPIKEQLKLLVNTDAYRLGFHIMPPTGWLNDPNGLFQLKGLNHIYFQYTPFTPTWGMKLWGHYTSKDWISYKEEEPFLFADCAYDRDGVYSGSAFVKDDEIHYYYTGNVKYTDKEYNYITNGREQNTMEVISKDGYSYKEKRRIMKNSDYPKDMSCHVRDPKVFEKDGVYYMVIGARSKDDRGCVLLYRSDDLKEWVYHMRIQSNEPFGYMWECPDIIELQGKTYLICCPQGVPQDGMKYQNVYQFGYFELQLDIQEKTYTISSFVELDKGFDIYAPQTFVDEQGRRILISWMGIPDAPYNNEETIKKGWQHALTMPRELYEKDEVLCQRPLVEFQALRRDEVMMNVHHHAHHEVSRQYECKIDFTTCHAFQASLRDGITLMYDGGILSLQLDACGYGRDSRCVEISEISDMQIFVDTSSIEIFVNGGKEVLTSRYYTHKITPLHIEGEVEGTMALYELKSFQIEELKE